MAISLPLTSRMRSSGRDRRSRPAISARPVILLVLDGNKRIMDSEVTLLPEPDSPTIATVSRGAILKLRSRTTGRHPPPDRNDVVRFSTLRTGSLEAFPGGIFVMVILTPYLRVGPSRRERRRRCS